MELALNQLEGKYEILEKLSEGGMGAVYKVRHRLLDELRVVKVMRPHLSQDEVLRARFVREAKMAIRLRHRNIAQIYDFTADQEGSFFLVMEFIDGINCHELLKLAGPPSLGVALEIAHQSLGVLSYLHRKEIIHRDISPDNLMLCRDEEGGLLVKLIDLGIAKAAGGEEHLTATGAFLGKVRYSSPEQFRTRDGADVGPPADLYSFGVVLYELLTGHYPIKGSSLTSLMSGHLSEPPLDFSVSDPKGELPPALRSCVLRALEKDPRQRFPSARAFRTKIAAIRAEVPVGEMEIEEILRLSSAPTEKLKVQKPGSTQDRLDRNFGALTTPVPGPGVAQTEPSDQQAQFRALLLGIEKLIESGHFDEAALQIGTAESINADHVELKRLTRNLKASDARFRARRQAALATIEGSLSAEDLMGAERLLKRAKREFGSAGDFDALSKKIRVARKEIAERDQRIAEILEAARQLMEAEEWEDAVLMIREVLILREGHEEAEEELVRAQAGLNAQIAAERLRKEIEDSIASIRACLKKKEPDEARRALALAKKLSGELQDFEDIEREIEELEGALRRERTRALVEEARCLIRAQDFENAIQYLDEALRLNPDDSEAGECLTEAKEGQRLKEEEDRRQHEIHLALEGIDHLVMAGRLETAVHNIEDILQRHGESDDALSLRERVREELEERDALREKIMENIQEATVAEDEGDFVRARKALLKARDGAAEFPEVLAELEAAIQRTGSAEKDYRHRLEVEGACDSIRKQLKSGALEEAARELGLAERVYGEDGCWLRLRQELSEAQRDEAIHDLLTEAFSGKLGFEAMIDRLQRALRLDPSSQKIRDLLEKTSRSRDELQCRQRQDAIDEALVVVDDLISKGRFAEALAGVEAALKEFGVFPQGLALKLRLKTRVLSDED